MRIEKFLQALDVYEALYSRSECPEKAEILRIFRDAFSGQEEKTVVAVVNHVVKYWKSIGHEHAYPEGLKQAIIGIEEVHRSLGPVGVANDFKKLLELFLGQGDLSMAVFANDFMEAVIATPVARAKKPQKTDSAKVKDYVRSLKNSIPDTDQFREILDRMAAPRKVTKAELVLIAEQFLGYQENYKTKGQAVEALRVWQLHNAIQKSQDRASVEV